MSKKTGLPLGIDVGGSGIKGAPVDLSKGAFASKRKRIDTPAVSTPEAVADVIDQIVDHFDDVRGDSPIGITIPGVVTRGVVRSAANIDKSWLDFDARVLSLADAPTVPLLERAKFLAIFASNLDEFFQVRVAGLKDQHAAGLGRVSADGLGPGQQLLAIRARVEDLLARLGANDGAKPVVVLWPIHHRDVAARKALYEVRAVQDPTEVPPWKAVLGFEEKARQRLVGLRA